MIPRLAKSRSLVLAEAYHWRFHPIASRLKEVMRSGELGQPTSLEVTAGLPSPDALFSAGRSALRLQPRVRAHRYFATSPLLGAAAPAFAIEPESGPP